VNQARVRQLQALLSSAPPHRTLPATPRVAALSLLPCDASHRVARALADGARALGWESRVCCTHGPRDVDALPHCTTLHEFRPELTICIGHVRTILPIPPTETTCLWFVHERQVPSTPPELGSILLAGSPRIAASLKERFPGHDVHACFAAAPAAAPASDPAAFRAADTVVVIGDLPDTEAKTYQIEESSHQRLWKRLNERAHHAWQTAAALDPEKLVTQCARDANVVLRHRENRARFVQLARAVCLPAAGWADIVEVVCKAGLRVLAVGQGWERLADDRLQPAGADLLAMPDDDWPDTPAACVIAGRQDPLTPVTLWAAARGWPLVMYDAGGRTLAAALGGVLTSEKHLTPFADTEELQAALKCKQATPDLWQSRVVSARDHVRRDHTYARRLQALLAGLT
jgi:hypothetical protein